MKVSILGSALAASALALAMPTHPQYNPPEGGWDKVKYPHETGANLPSYPPPNKGGHPSKSPFVFTSTYHVKAVGSEVINGTTRTPGDPNAVGYFNYGINAPEDVICWNITLINVKGEYSSPARTATHIHQGARGASGPPRVVFPNPVGDDKLRRSLGCQKGPFETGVKMPPMTGPDTGAGFKVAQIEANPAGFFTDAHTVNFVPGVVRGQLG